MKASRNFGPREFPEGKLIGIEKTIISLISSLISFKGISPKAAKIYAYIYARNKITQRTLQECTKLSAGMVSSALNKFEEYGIITKMRDVNTREYVYTLIGGMKKVAIQLFEQNKSMIEERIAFFYAIAEKLKGPELKNKKGYDNIAKFVTQVNILFPSYLKVLEQVLEELKTGGTPAPPPSAIAPQVSGIEDKNRGQSSRGESMGRFEMPEISPEIMVIEQEIVAFFRDRVAEATNASPVFMAVMAYFYTRQKLTQADLRNLTGFSAGSISNVVTFIEKQMHMVIKQTIPGTHTKIYIMDSPYEALVRFMTRMNAHVENVRKKLVDLKGKLDQDTSLHELAGYRNLRSFIEDFSSFLLIYPKIPEMLEKHIEK